MAVIHPSGDVQAFWRTKQAAESGQAKAQYNLGLMFANGVGVAQDFEQALFWYQKSAQQGFSPAQYILAGKYANGQGVARDLRQALNWYLKASDKGNSRALFKLGQMLSVPQDEFAQNCYRQAAEKGVVEAQILVASNVAATVGDSEGEQQALAWYQKAAESGLPAAQYILGTYHESGKCGPQDIQQALVWYRKAARQGFAAAQTQLGLMYGRGEGVPKDHKQALAWIARAAEQGDPEACYQLGLMYELGLGEESDRLQAESNYLKAAESGDVRAQLRLAALCSIDREMLARHWYEEAAANGSGEAMFILGRMHAQDSDDGKNIDKAISLLLAAAERGESSALLELAELFEDEMPAITAAWYRRAADEGNPEAQCTLAQRLNTGSGVGKSPDNARYWFQKAAESGLPEAQYEFGKLLLPQEPSEAIAWFRKAARQGVAKAMTSLGKLYASGEVLGKDRRQAAAWLVKAAEQGDCEAQTALGQLFAEGSGQGDAYKQAEHWYRQAIDAGGGDQPLLALAELFLKTSDPSAEIWLRLAAERGMDRAQVQLANLLLARQGGGSASEALSYYIKSAAQGNADALNNLAQLSASQPQAFSRTLRRLALDAATADGVSLANLSEGLSEEVLEKPDQGVGAYLQAAKEGDVVAQWQLAELYAKGKEGVRKNLKQALTWYEQSAQAGFPAAQAALAVLLATGQGDERDSRRAVYWWQKAAEQGDAESQYNLALMYEQGEGCAPDPALAMQWMRKSALQGIAAAQLRLGLAYAMGKTVAPNLVEACAWFAIAAEAGNDEAALANLRHAESLMNAAQQEAARQRFAELKALFGRARSAETPDS